MVAATDCLIPSIVAVHGLGANTAWTWTTKGVHWLSNIEMLPRILPKARIMVFGYDSQRSTAQTVAHQTSIFAKQLLDLVLVLRQVRINPITYLHHKSISRAHSMYRIVVTDL